MNDGLSLDGSASRVAQLLLEKDEKRAQGRRSDLLYLIVRFLGEQSYRNSADMLFKEAQLTKSTQVCDNIDLEIILQEYTDSYYTRFNRYPKFCKKIESESTGNLANTTKITRRQNFLWSGKTIVKQDDNKSVEECNGGKAKVSQKPTCFASDEEFNFGIKVSQIWPSHNATQPTEKRAINHEKSLKPIGELYPIGSEWREIAEVISGEIVLKNLNVRWNDIKGLNKCKKLLKEATVYPILYPSIFSGKFGPWRGVLLYGPPGTGKTMLAKAVATECQCTFFNITSSSIISKWRGDSEKYVRVLLDLAHFYSPTIIFIDEIDWIGTKNGDLSSTYSEPARRFRAELLNRLDGLLSAENTNVMLLASTNMPWNIDAALLRRLERRIFVDLPDMDTRRQILQYYVSRSFHRDEQFTEVLKATENYSCAELKLLCKEAWMMQMQDNWENLEGKRVNVEDVVSDDNVDVDRLIDAMGLVKPSVADMRTQYVEWSESLSLSK